MNHDFKAIRDTFNLLGEALAKMEADRTLLPDALEEVEAEREATSTQYTNCEHLDSGWCLSCVAKADRISRLAYEEVREVVRLSRAEVKHLQSKLKQTADGEWVGPMDTVFDTAYYLNGIKACDVWKFLELYYSTKQLAADAAQQKGTSDESNSR